VWKVKVLTFNPVGEWISLVDAQTGEILDQYNGLITVTKGRGNAFRTNEDALEWKTSKVSLPRLFTKRDIDPDDLVGHLIGKYIRVGWTDGETFYDSMAYAKNFRYFYHPVFSQDSFDEVNAYYHFDRANKWWRRHILRWGGQTWFFTDEYVPCAVVNWSGLLNAFYSSVLCDGEPGFGFGDEEEVDGVVYRDFAQDAGIIYHEFAHAIQDWTGSPLLGGTAYSYSGAIAEGDADYFSCSQRNKPLIGEVLDPPPEELGILRDLSGQWTGNRRYPEDVDCPVENCGVLGQPWSDYPFPEVHHTGEIWGQLLWDLRGILGRAKTDRYVHWTDAGYVANFGGHNESDVDFLDWALAFYVMLMDIEGPRIGEKKFFKKTYSIFTDRGIFTRSPYAHDQNYFGSEAEGSDDPGWAIYYFTQNGRWKNRGYLLARNSDPALENGNPSEYFFQIDFPAQTLTLDLRSRDNDLEEPRLRLLSYDATNDLWTEIAPTTITTDQYSTLALYDGPPLNTLLVVEVYSTLPPAGSIGPYILIIDPE
jgi:hypothetical protein